jgi:hypothetical protein
MTWSLSTARVDITPTAGHPMAGYSATATARLATGTYSPLHATAVVLWDGPRPLVLVSADVLGWPRGIHRAVRAGLTAVGVSVPTADLVLTATHTHGGPCLPERLDPVCAYGLHDLTAIDAYGAGLVASVVGLVSSALLAPRTAVTLDATTTTQAWSANREGLPYAETAVPVLVARRADGLPAAVVFSYGAHPVTAGNHPEWDGDYPSAACAVVEAAVPGCVALFVLGPAGDQDPLGPRGIGVRGVRGAALGAAVVAAAGTTGRALTGVAATDYGEVALPLDIVVTPANLAAVRTAYTTRLADPDPMVRRHARQCIDLIDAGGPHPTSVPLPVQSWRLAGAPDLRIAWIGGEPVSGYGVYLRDRYGGPGNVLVAGYAGELPCYVPSDALLPPLRASSSYAGGWASDHPGIAGGSMCAYGWLAHLRTGAGGAETALVAELHRQLG